MKCGDVVIFLKTDAEKGLGDPVWRVGRVVVIDPSRDGCVRAVEIEYKNVNESVFRKTRRSARKVAVIHREGDLELVDELNAASKAASVQFLHRRDPPNPGN